MGNFYIPNKEVPPKKKVVGGTLVFSDPNDPEYKYRKQMYNDSLDLHNYFKNEYNNLDKTKLTPYYNKSIISTTQPYKNYKGELFNNIQGSLFNINDKFYKSELNERLVKNKSNIQPNEFLVYKKEHTGNTGTPGYMTLEERYKKPVVPIKLEVPPIPEKPKVPITPPIAPPTTPPVKEEQISYEEWYKTVPKEKNDTTSYNLKRAYELAPKEQLNAFVQDPDAHLMSAYQTSDGNYEFVKSKNHPTLNKELDWYNSDNPDAIDFRNNYDLDTTGEYYKYIKKEQPKVEEVKKPEYVQGSTIWLNNTTPMLEHNGKNYILDINSPEVNQVYTEQGNKLVTKELTQAQIDLLLKATK